MGGGGGVIPLRVPEARRHWKQEKSLKQAIILCDDVPTDSFLVAVNLLIKLRVLSPLLDVSRAEGHRVFQTDSGEFLGPARRVNVRHPSIAPPVGEDARIVEAEDVDVRPMNELVRQNVGSATRVLRSDDSDARRIVAFQRRDELLRPAAGQHARVVIDAVQVVNVVDVRFQHRVVLRPRRLPGVAALHQVDRNLDAGRAVGRAQSSRFFVERPSERRQEAPVAERRVGVVVGEVDPVVEAARTGGAAERRQEFVEERQL